MRKAIEILKESPLSLEALRAWVRADLSEQFKEQEERARKENPNFELMREMWMQEQLQIAELATVLDTNSPYLFNFFDAHNLFIEINPSISSISENVIVFNVCIFNEKMDYITESNLYSTRRDASFVAINEAFKLLENKLA